MLHLAMSPTRIASPMATDNEPISQREFVSPPILFSPLGTPPTEHAQRIAEEGLTAAEALDAEGMMMAAAELKAATLAEAAQAYSRQTKRHEAARKQNRHPLAKVGGQTSPAVQEELAIQSQVSTTGFPTPPRTPKLHATTSAANSAFAAVSVPSGGVVTTVPTDVLAVVISNATLVTHLEGAPFTIYQLHVPLLAGEHIAFRRYSEFVAFDMQLRECLGDRLLPMAPLDCVWLHDLPPLPPRTIPFLQSAIAPSVIAHRWAGLQRYLDATLERVADHPAAFGVFRDFLCLP
jgi:hypothetical protein